MPATVTVRRQTGPTTALVDTDITAATSRLSLSDSPSPGTNNPVQIPSSGSNYSFWSSVYLNADTTPAGTIDTVKWYSSGTNNYGTGVTMQIGLASTYAEATGTATTGNLLNSVNYPTISGISNAFGYTSASALAVPGSINNPATGRISQFIVQQLTVATTAIPGIIPASTFTITYNET